MIAKNWLPTHSPGVVAGCALAVWMLSGCGWGGGGGLGQVRGTVTLDGNPLPGAEVLFTSEEGEGRAPKGRTDEAGRYELKMSLDQRGAPPGHYKVWISTGEAGGTELIPERVPSQYNHNSELTADVTPGRNTIDFELSSEGEIIEAREEAYDEYSY